MTRAYNFALAICLLLNCSPVLAHTIDIIELPNGGGTRAITDGSILNTFPGSETISVGVNFNDGDYVPQVINVNVYDDAAHTIVSDLLTITVFAQNPPQITVGLTSLAGVALHPVLPEGIGLTETGALQTVTTLTNARGIQTTIRLQSDESGGVVAGAPEPSTVPLAVAGLTAMILFNRRRQARN
jgi:hypothetical protein